MQVTASMLVPAVQVKVAVGSVTSLGRINEIQSPVTKSKPDYRDTL